MFQILPKHNANHCRNKSCGSSNCSKHMAIKLPCKAASYNVRKLKRGNSVQQQNVPSSSNNSVIYLSIRIVVYYHCQYKCCHCSMFCLQFNINCPQLILVWISYHLYVSVTVICISYRYMYQLPLYVSVTVICISYHYMYFLSYTEFSHVNILNGLFMKSKITHAGHFPPIWIG